MQNVSGDCTYIRSLNVMMMGLQCKKRVSQGQAVIWGGACKEHVAQAEAIQKIQKNSRDEHKCQEPP